MAESFPKQSGTIFKVQANTGEGLVYFLLALFFALNFLTPVCRYYYVRYVANLAEIARIEAMKASKIMTASMNDSAQRVAHRIKYDFQV